MSHEIDRRTFVKAGAAAVGAAMATGRAHGANERIRAGFIGVANRGGQDLAAALAHPQLEVAALCDVDSETLQKRAAKLDNKPAVFEDYRKLLESKDIDVVFIATPDHWHALQTIHACEAGKDVYIEKPLSLTITEGRKMVEAARRTKRVVQAGTQRRSSPLFKELHERIKNDEVGKVTVAHCCRINNMWPNGIGHAKPSEPPKTLNWDLWLGPHPFVPYQENIAPYKFRWWQTFSSQCGNWGIHYFDLLRWLLDEEAPIAVSAHGGRFAVDDDRTIPDTMMAVFEFASGRLLHFGQYEASGIPLLRNEVELRGTKGIVYAGNRGYEIVPERSGQFQENPPRAEARNVTLPKGEDDDPTTLHVGNFLECVKSRGLPNADVEIAHRSTTFSHLANIAMTTKSRIEWDAKSERITNNEKANALLHYDYRKPWTL